MKFIYDFLTLWGVISKLHSKLNESLRFFRVISIQDSKLNDFLILFGVINILDSKLNYFLTLSGVISTTACLDGKSSCMYVWLCVHIKKHKQLLKALFCRRGKFAPPCQVSTGFTLSGIGVIS